MTSRRMEKNENFMEAKMKMVFAKGVFMLAALSLALVAQAYENLDSALKELKQNGIFPRKNEYKCPPGFTMSAELSPGRKMFSSKSCQKRFDPSNQTDITVEVMVFDKKLQIIGRIFVSEMKIGNNEKTCSVETLKKFIDNHKIIKVVGQSILFDLGSDLEAYIECLGQRGSYSLSIQTKSYQELNTIKMKSQ